MEKIKVLMILTYYYPYCSGVTEYARRLAEELVNNNYEVTVFTTRFDKSLKKEEVINGVKVIRNRVFFRLSKGVISPFFVLRGICMSRNFDFVNLHLPLFEAGGFSLLINRKKIIATYHCDLTLKGGFIEKIIGFIYTMSARISLLRCRKIVAYTEDYASNSLLLKDFQSKTYYALPLIDSAHFNSKNKDKCKKNFCIAPKNKVIGFIGRFVFEKGISYLLDSISYILEEYPNAKFILAGDYKNVAGGSIYHEIQEKIKKNYVNIILPGKIDYKNLPSFYSACDVIVLPSIDKLEAFGIVQAESMLCGTPVVASNLPGVRVPINLTGMGILAEPKNSKSIADAVLRILKNHDSFAVPRIRLQKSFDNEKTIFIYKTEILK